MRFAVVVSVVYVWLNVLSRKRLAFYGMTGSVALGVIVGLLLLSFRKFAQMFFVIGRAIAPKKLRPKIKSLHDSWVQMHNYFWRDKRQLFKITNLVSPLVANLFFFLALKAWTPFLTNLALSPLAILAGLLPLTFTSVSTQDTALIAFY